MPNISRASTITYLHLCLLLNACASGGHAPVVTPAQDRSPAKSSTTYRTAERVHTDVKTSKHTVKRGDTLYSIAWNYGLDYRHVAVWNGIRSPYTIYPGQQIRLQPVPQKLTVKSRKAPQKKATPLTPGPISRRPESQIEPPAVTKPSPPDVQHQEVAEVPKPQPLPNIPGPVKWLWPAQGKIVKMNTPISKNGIDITGAEGQNIHAAAPGEVVYSGSGLLGYGRLIIIKHNDTYLSAYAHNKELLVKEGDRVNAGQKIALMGRTNDGRTLLHFEIRKNGQPVDPLAYLPKH